MPFVGPPASCSPHFGHNLHFGDHDHRRSPKKGPRALTGSLACHEWKLASAKSIIRVCLPIVLFIKTSQQALRKKSAATSQRPEPGSRGGATISLLEAISIILLGNGSNSSEAGKIDTDTAGWQPGSCPP